MIADIDGPVHYAHYEGPAGAPRVMYLHGLGGSLSNWSDLAPLLTSHVRAIAVDLPGFGASPSAGRRTTVAANAAIVTRLLHEVVDEPTILIGNSMGALISTLVAGNEPDRVRAVVLIDPPLPVAAPLRVHGDVRRSAVLGGMPGIGEVLFNRRLATVPAHERVRQMLQRCCADPNRISSAMWEATVADEQQRSSDGPARAGDYLWAARSIVWTLARSRRHSARLAGLKMSVLLLHGRHDRLVPITAARAAACRFPDWTVRELDSGHIPHMENPQQVADAVVPWLACVAAKRTPS